MPAAGDQRQGQAADLGHSQTRLLLIGGVGGKGLCVCTRMCPGAVHTCVILPHCDPWESTGLWTQLPSLQWREARPPAGAWEEGLEGRVGLWVRGGDPAGARPPCAEGPRMAATRRGQAEPGRTAGPGSRRPGEATVPPGQGKQSPPQPRAPQSPASVPHKSPRKCRLQPPARNRFAGAGGLCQGPQHTGPGAQQRDHTACVPDAASPALCQKS